MPKSPLTLAAALVPSAGEQSNSICESVRRWTHRRRRFHRPAFPGKERHETTPPQAICASGHRRRGSWQRRAEEDMIVEGAWVLVIAVVVFTAIVAVVLVGSGKLYNPDRSHE